MGDILGKIEIKLTSWIFRSLNIAGRIILLKFILQVIPLYLFSALATPNCILKVIRNIQCNFLLSGVEASKK